MSAGCARKRCVLRQGARRATATAAADRKRELNLVALARVQHQLDWVTGEVPGTEQVHRTGRSASRSVPFSSASVHEAPYVST
jgi:hypothetical protein